MKHFLIFGTLLLLVVSSSCSKEDDEKIVETNESARYYVKYEVKYNTYHYNASRVIKFATENGIQTLDLVKQSNEVSWEGTYGPVNKNFVASINCDTPGYNYSSTIHARIYVSREKEPFVIKAEGENSHSLVLQYKIDF